MNNKPAALIRRHDTAGIDWNDVAALFTNVGWTRRDPFQLAAAFATSSHVIFIHEGERLVALGRTLDDGRYYAMLVDVAVAPSHQGAGLGPRSSLICAAAWSITVSSRSLLRPAKKVFIAGWDGCTSRRQ